jgi:hypothetical protein
LILATFLLSLMRTTQSAELAGLLSCGSGLLGENEN